MFNHETELLITVLAGVLPGPDSAATPSKTWADAREAMAACGEQEADLAAAVNGEDAAALHAIFDQWLSNKRLLPLHDREILKHAMKAYRKRLKATLLDANSSLGGGALTAGQRMKIVGIRPHERFPRPVWEELARQKRLIAGRDGTYELAPEPNS